MIKTNAESPSPTTEDTQRFLTLDQAAERLMVPLGTVKTLVRQGRLDVLNLGSDEEPIWRVTPDALEDILDPRPRRETVPQFIQEMLERLGRERPALDEDTESLSAIIGTPTGPRKFDAVRFTTDNDDGSCLDNLVKWVAEKGGQAHHDNTELFVKIQGGRLTLSVTEWLCYHGDKKFTSCSDEHLKALFR